MVPVPSVSMWLLFEGPAPEKDFDRVSNTRGGESGLAHKCSQGEIEYHNTHQILGPFADLSGDKVTEDVAWFSLCCYGMNRLRTGARNIGRCQMGLVSRSGAPRL